MLWNFHHGWDGNGSILKNLGAAFPGWAKLEAPLESPNPTPSTRNRGGIWRIPIIGIIPWLELIQDFGIPSLSSHHLEFGFSSFFLPDRSFPFFPGFGNSFNIDTKRPQIIAGSRESFFGYTVQQHDIGGKKW